MKNKLIVPTVVAVLVLLVLWFLASGDVKFSTSLFDADANQIDQQSVSVPISAQSMFNGDFSILMQSSQPITDETSAIFRAVVDNPFKSNAEIKSISLIKNDRALYIKKTTALLGPGESFIYKTDNIDLTGNEGQRNTIKIEFLVQDLEGKEQIETFEYNYYYVFKCNGDSDCESSNFLCDRGNSARFSTSPKEFFCVKICADHTDCFDGQICIKGLCGY